jgi:hypothetical protein
VAELLLKARPTLPQLRDRLRPPLPDGLELYLDTADVATEQAMDQVVRNLDAVRRPGRWTLLIEGPVRSLDGAFFETTRDHEVDRELVRRLVRLAGRIGARAVNLHLIRPRASPDCLGAAARQRDLDACLPFTRYFVERAAAGGVLPTLENMPPVLRMRQGGFYYSPIGMPAEDLAWLADRVPGLGLCLDLSHAQLYVNACSAARRPKPPARHARFLRALRELPQAASVWEYAARLGSSLVSCHVANASGLLGEGRSYARGDLDLDLVLPPLARRARYFVTETLERRPERAILMRAALRRMRLALEGRPAADLGAAV